MSIRSLILRLQLSPIVVTFIIRLIIRGGVNLPLFIGVWDFLKIVEGESRFSCKNGVSPYREEVSVEEGVSTAHFINNALIS